jgi:hypothetical protein
MKNFSDLLDTKLHLDVLVNNEVLDFEVDVHSILVFNAEDTVSVDGIDVLPKYKHLAENGVLVVAEPFYNWYHKVTGQGWLLVPQ